MPFEDVSHYPRPPRIERFTGTIRIDFAGRTIASTACSWRILETFHPPTYYLPQAAFADGTLVPGPHPASHCEWKGRARYLDVVAGEQRAPAAAWTYDAPREPYGALCGHVALYAAPMDHVEVAGHRVEPQPGSFYGGWLTANIKGPIKGGPRTLHW